MVFPLSEGSYTVNVSKEFVPYDSAKDILADRKESLLVDIVPFLISTKNELIVIDPGLGFLGKQGEYQIIENISKEGFSADNVSIVLLSHLHKDHAGGICYGKEGAFNLMFPNARYYCQEKEMQFARSKRDSPSYLQDRLEFLTHHPNLIYLNGSGELNPFVRYEVSGGHTPYHQIFLIESDNQKFFFGGDVLPQPSQLQRKFQAKYDYDGKLAASKRIEYGKRGAEANWTCLFFHSAAVPMAKVSYEGGKFLIRKL